MNKKILLSLFIFLSLFCANSWAAVSKAGGEEVVLRDFLAKVYQTMDSHYYLPVSRAAYEQFMLEFPVQKLKALNSKSKKTPNFIHLGAGLLVNRLKSPQDTFTNFVPPEKSKEFKEKVYAVTIDLGIEGKKTDKGFLITRVQKHSEAFEKKIRAGDYLRQIGQADVTSLAEKEIIRRLTPEQGKKTVLVLWSLQSRALYEVMLESKSYFKETVEIGPSPKPGWIVLKISHFNQMTGPDFGEELKRISTDATKTLVIDLRDNGGGPPLAAREILGYFTPLNDYLFAIARKKQKPVMLASPGQIAPYKGTVYILVNQKTGSAAEMFSGVLQSKKLAKLAGQKTAGATYLKSIYDFEDKSMIFMITSLTFFPDRSVFPKDGLTPDFLIKDNQDALAFIVQKT